MWGDALALPGKKLSLKHLEKLSKDMWRNEAPRNTMHRLQPRDKERTKTTHKRGDSLNIYWYILNQLPVDVWKDDRSQGGNLGVGQVTWQLLQDPHGALHSKLVLPFQCLSKKITKGYYCTSGTWKRKMTWKTMSRENTIKRLQRKYYKKVTSTQTEFWKGEQQEIFFEYPKIKI